MVVAGAGIAGFFSAERVEAHFGNRVGFRVMGDVSFRHEPFGLLVEFWRLDAEILFLHDHDISLMPVPDDAWSKGKCGFKVFIAMVCGVAVVISSVGVSSQIA